MIDLEKGVKRGIYEKLARPVVLVPDQLPRIDSITAAEMESARKSLDGRLTFRVTGVPKPRRATLGWM